MKRAVFSLAVLFGLAIAAHSASAQQQPQLPSPAPPEAAPPLQARQAPAPQSSIPPLPPSRPCASKNDILGGWRLVKIFEEPRGPEMQAFSAEPYQFYSFGDDDLYKKYNTRENRRLPLMRNAVEQMNVGLQQYVVAMAGDTGMIYFYKDSIATDNLACFIVTNPTNQYMVGEMILMPPIEQARGRLIKVYQKVWEAPRANAGQNRQARGRRPRKPSTGGGAPIAPSPDMDDNYQ